MDMIQSIRNVLVPVHRQGWPFVLAFLVAAVLLGLLWEPLFWLGLILTLWCAYFFRDPERVTPQADHVVVSPADGRVSLVGPVVPPAELLLGDGPRLRISIFMNVFDCHINRAPVQGRVERIVYREGKFLNAELDKASEENERSSMVLASPHGEVGVVQIAGAVARRPRPLDPAGQGRAVEASEGIGAAVVEQPHLGRVEQRARLGSGKRHGQPPSGGMARGLTRGRFRPGERARPRHSPPEAIRV